MQVFDKKIAIQAYIEQLKKSGNTVGFVPTMGALHKGHISLIEAAKKECDIVVSSIFVNPTQFNDKNDYTRYPRTVDNDLRMLELAGCSIVFTPTEQEMYPEKDIRFFDLAGLDTRMEGAHRPGHFNGVAQIVTKLFETVLPDKAFFGEKDFQQLAIIKHITKQANLPIQIIGCPTLRETDGLAMSSRNTLLTQQERALAPKIYQVLTQLKKDINTFTLQELCARALQELSAEPLFSPEYLEVVDSETLLPVFSKEKNKRVVVCTAVKLGNVRLIDNIIL
ncbi:MAG: pantoate--beta-alanine ligase [Bacteroidetes bacterium]|nr:pantoate--beta-alanine ligase [Bacteroidota bacterium]